MRERIERLRRLRKLCNLLAEREKSLFVAQEARIRASDEERATLYAMLQGESSAALLFPDMVIGRLDRMRQARALQVIELEKRRQAAQHHGKRVKLLDRMLERMLQEVAAQEKKSALKCVLAAVGSLPPVLINDFGSGEMAADDRVVGVRE